MSKTNFSIKTIVKSDAHTILDTFHYLKDFSKGFKSGFNYGCYHNDRLVGVIIFTGLPVPELAVGMLGLERTEQEGLFELSRLCLHPDMATEHNLASWFVSNSIKLLRKDTKVRLILSYADSAFHNGTVYRACNFTYYGKSTPKSDFFILNADGTYTKHSRGKVKGIKGEWRPRTQKHRFVLKYDKTLNMKWSEEKWKSS